MRTRTSLGWMIALGLSAFITSAVHALPEFPQELQDATNAPCLPHCNLCHRDDNAGEGTVDKPFGISMERSGLEGGGVAAAVSTLRARGIDSDGDGAADIDEIAMGNDPNTSYDARICGPHVGCGVSGGSEPSNAGLAAFLLALGIFIRPRPRRRSASFRSGSHAAPGPDRAR